MTSAGLPAWKQAILERKRAKLAAGLEMPPRGAPAARRPDSEGKRAEEEEEGERLVVAESLGPLRENPFMRLESERRRRRRRTSGPRAPPPAPRPLSPPKPPPSPSSETPALAHLLELYGAMPGIRTIRADNILIIESNERDAEGKPGGGASDVTAVGRALPSPRPFWRQQQPSQPHPQGGGASDVNTSPSPRPLWRQQQQQCQQDPLRALLSRSGSPVTEIRASEVVIYEPRPPDPQEKQQEKEPDPEPGRVSRLLQKFDQRKGPRGNKAWWRGGGSTETAAAAVVPKSPSEEPRLPPHSPPHGRGFVQKIGSNSFTVNPRGRLRLASHPPVVISNGPLEPQEKEKEIEDDGDEPATPPRNCGAPTATAPTVPSPPSPAPTASPWKPKSDKNPEAPPANSSASPDSSATMLPRSLPPTPPPLAFGNNGAFEIRPAPKPDLAAIPAHDLQAQALASLRLNSRNSFLFVPRRKEPAQAPEKQAETPVPVTCIDEDLLEPEPGSLPPLRVLSPRLEGFDVPLEGGLEMEEAAVASLCPVSFPAKNGNTFTVVPKRKPPAAGLETFHRAWLPEEEEEEEGKARAPHLELGHLLKKRYPTVHEIEVIGGYLSLDKSCMSKSGSQRKKMKISFNESSLQTMFEYPSESSLVEEEEEEEEEEDEEEEYATEVDEAPLALFIPRATGTRHPNTTNSGLSSYTPKHSLEFGKWQEKHQEGAPPSPGAFPQDADRIVLQDMLTPADTDSLSDFSSEPALYF
ncbi:taperin [Anolis sagrei]|uniref:taperin n=1 Tax=Anolis sagrei TaxID=38937 RepID=UPI00351F8AD1